MRVFPIVTNITYNLQVSSGIWLRGDGRYSLARYFNLYRSVRARSRSRMFPSYVSKKFLWSESMRI